MVNIDNFKIGSLQVSIFTPEVLFSKTKILERMMSCFGDHLDGDTVSIPIPGDAPKEIPRITLCSGDGKLKLDIAESRVNIFRYLNDNEAGVDTNEFFDFSLRIIREYKNFTRSIIGRLALVTERFISNQKPASTLADYFCGRKSAKELFGQSLNFEIHSHKKYRLKEFNINSWVRFKTGTLKKNSKPIILVMQDINTLAEELEETDFGIEQAEIFLRAAYKKQEQVLCKYFPKKE